MLFTPISLGLTKGPSICKSKVASISSNIIGTMKSIVSITIIMSLQDTQISRPVSQNVAGSKSYFFTYLAFKSFSYTGNLKLEQTNVYRCPRGSYKNNLNHFPTSSVQLTAISNIDPQSNNRYSVPSLRQEILETEFDISLKWFITAYRDPELEELSKNFDIRSLAI